MRPLTGVEPISAPHPKQSFATQRQQIANDALAVESAFAACRTEEEAIYAAGPLSPTTERQARIAMRVIVKNDLLRQR